MVRLWFLCVEQKNKILETMGYDTLHLECTSTEIARPRRLRIAHCLIKRFKLRIAGWDVGDWTARGLLVCGTAGLWYW